MQYPTTPAGRNHKSITNVTDAPVPLSVGPGAGSCYCCSSMSTQAPAAPQKINLRRPDVMEAVQAQVLSHYRSDLVNRILDKGHVLSANGLLTIKLAKKFGFCYGVERAIDLAYAARKVFPVRSEEHTSELQSLRHLVCRLLLE